MSIRFGNTTQLLILLIGTALLTIIFGFFDAWLALEKKFKLTNPDTLSIQFSYLFDTTIQLPEVAIKQTFTETDLNSAPAHYGKLNQWFSVTIQNQSSEQQDIATLFDNPMTDQYTLYEIGPEGKAELKSIFGDKVEKVSLEQRILPTYFFSLEKRQTRRFLIHRITTGSPYTPFLFFDQTTYEEYQRVVHLIWGSFIGLVILMSVYNLILFSGVHDRTYLYYVGYILSLLILLGVVHGFGYYIFPINLQRTFSAGVIVMNSTAAYFALLFAKQFLNITQQDGWPNRASLLLSQVILGFGVFSAFAPEYISAPAFSVVQIATYVMVSTLIGRRLKTRFRWTKYYLLSWIPFFLGAAIAYLLFSGVLEYSFLNRHALLLAVIFEMGFISMALADRLGEKERQRLFNATHDFKYLLANEALLEQAIEKHSLLNSEKLSIIAIEISNYDAVIPYVNSEQQHQLVLNLARLFAQNLSNHFDLIDIDAENEQHKQCALLRGDLFAFLLKNANSNQIKSVLNTLSNRDNFNPLQDVIPYRIHCIFGATIQSGQEQNDLDLISNAKRAINQAQEKNLQCVIYNPLNIESERKIRLAQDLGNAIAENSLQLYHQPQLVIADPSFQCSEVLLRWYHPELGNIPTYEFIRIAEETGLIKRLTFWVLDTTFKQAKVLLDSGERNLNISINVSAFDLSRLSFSRDIITLLNRYLLKPEHFTLEITETSKFTDEAIMSRNFLTLTSYGFRFAIDDFGTGYSSLNYTITHPFKELKIDRTFVDQMLISPRRLTIVTATVHMAKELGLNITAEGVEDLNTFQVLKELGCDKIQGYYIARPMPFEEYKNWHQSSISEFNVGETLHLRFKPIDNNGVE